jgi:type IV secretory pathway TrbD component
VRRHPLSNIDDGREPHVIHASLYRPVLFAGADPAAVILEVATAFALVFGVGIHIVTLALATFYLTVVHALMVWIAKRDTDMIGLYVRSLSGHDYYLPHAGIHGPAPSPKSSIPSAN